MTPYLVALDLDGTLLSYDGSVSPAVLDAVAAVRGAGHHVVLASGRAVLAVLPVAQQLGIDAGHLVCSNGAVTVRLDAAAPGGFVVERVSTFDPAPALHLVQAGIPDALVAVEDVGVRHRVNRLWPSEELAGPQLVQGFGELGAVPVSRVVVRSPDHTRDGFHGLVEQLGLEDVTYSVGWSPWMDIAPQGVTKATALEDLRLAFGVDPASTMAVGDGHNDLDMLRWARRGVAMGHADEVVRATASEVTGGIADDGAASVLRSLLA